MVNHRFLPTFSYKIVPILNFFFFSSSFWNDRVWGCWKGMLWNRNIWDELFVQPRKLIDLPRCNQICVLGCLPSHREDQPDYCQWFAYNSSSHVSLTSFKTKNKTLAFLIVILWLLHIIFIFTFFLSFHSLPFVFFCLYLYQEFIFTFVVICFLFEKLGVNFVVMNNVQRRSVFNLSL